MKKEENTTEALNENNISIGQKVTTSKRGIKKEIEGIVKSVSFEKRSAKWFCLIECEDGTKFWKRVNKVKVI